jgi:hypothetical protein
VSHGAREKRQQLARSARDAGSAGVCQQNVRCPVRTRNMMRSFRRSVR